MDLSAFPRQRFAHLPTPLELLERLTAELKGPQIWLKRDDCTGLSTGGNKTRKLEFLLGDALAQGADMLITQGATQSNHARQTAAAAAKFGLGCHVLLENRTSSQSPDYLNNGNVLLNRWHGATMEHVAGGTDMAAALETSAAAFRAKGRKVYVIPGGGSNTVGALGYVDCALELVAQLNQMRLGATHLVHATGSAGTQAGIVAGLRVLNSPIKVLGIGVRVPQAKQEENVLRLAQQTAAKLGHPDAVKASDVAANCDYVGEGYGIPAKSTIDAIDLLGRLEGVLLDPVYSGKGMAGLIDLVRRGHFTAQHKIVFLHTGGSAALFGYPDIVRN